MLSNETYFWIINVFLLVFVINSVYTGGRSGEHVHIKLHIPEVYKKHTHVQTIVKHHFHPQPPPKQKKVHHFHHHHHSHKSKSKTNSHFHFENVPNVHSPHSSHSHYETYPTYKPKEISPIYSTEYHYGGGYKPIKSAQFKHSDESFRPSIPMYSVDEEEHMPEYSYNSNTHEDIMEEPENEYDETRTTPYYTAPLLGHQPLHTRFQSSSIVNDEEDEEGGAPSQWDGLLSKKYKSININLESPHSTTWPLSMPSELETYSTIPQYTKSSSKKTPKFVYDTDNYELGYTNSDFSAALESVGSGSNAKINKKWPSPYSLFSKD